MDQQTAYICTSKWGFQNQKTIFFFLNIEFRVRWATRILKECIDKSKWEEFLIILYQDGTVSVTFILVIQNFLF